MIKVGTKVLIKQDTLDAVLSPCNKQARDRRVEFVVYRHSTNGVEIVPMRRDSFEYSEPCRLAKTEVEEVASTVSGVSVTVPPLMSQCDDPEKWAKVFQDNLTLSPFTPLRKEELTECISKVIAAVRNLDRFTKDPYSKVCDVSGPEDRGLHNEVFKGPEAILEIAKCIVRGEDPVQKFAVEDRRNQFGGLAFLVWAVEKDLKSIRWAGEAIRVVSRSEAAEIALSYEKGSSNLPRNLFLGDPGSPNEGTLVTAIDDIYEGLYEKESFFSYGELRYE